MKIEKYFKSLNIFAIPSHNPSHSLVWGLTLTNMKIWSHQKLLVLIHPDQSSTTSHPLPQRHPRLQDDVSLQCLRTTPRCWLPASTLLHRPTMEASMAMFASRTIPPKLSSLSAAARLKRVTPVRTVSTVQTQLPKDFQPVPPKQYSIQRF